MFSFPHRNCSAKRKDTKAMMNESSGFQADTRTNGEVFFAKHKYVTFLSNIFDVFDKTYMGWIMIVNERRM